jgi:hypothetical protein
VGLTLEQLEPGAIIKTPELFRALGWDAPSAIYAGGGEGYPEFVLQEDKGVRIQPWMAGAYGKAAPMPEFELSKDTEIAKIRKAGLAKSWSTLKHNYASGTDPEFFVLDSLGAVLPTRSFLQDKKHCPEMFYDGLQAEITTGGLTCLEQLSRVITDRLNVVSSYATRMAKGARITCQNSFKFTPAQMQTFSDEDVRFRCSTSLNIYDDAGELPEAREYPWRFAGGHIHIGCGRRPAPVLKAMVRALDGIVGVAGVSLARNFDNPERRRMYGRAGEFRIPKHGLEYRVLSNFWLCSPLIFHLVFELTRYAYRIGEAGAFDLLYEGTEGEIRHCINRCDVSLACKLIERNSGLYTHILESIWGYNRTKPSRMNERAMETLQQGLEVAVSHPEAVLRNWELVGSYPMTWARQFA